MNVHTICTTIYIFSTFFIKILIPTCYLLIITKEAYFTKHLAFYWFSCPTRRIMMLIWQRFSKFNKGWDGVVPPHVWILKSLFMDHDEVGAMNIIHCLTQEIYSVHKRWLESPTKLGQWLMINTTYVTYMYMTSYIGLVCLIN